LSGRINPAAYRENIEEIFPMFTQGISYYISLACPRRFASQSEAAGGINPEACEVNFEEIYKRLGKGYRIISFCLVQVYARGIVLSKE